MIAVDNDIPHPALYGGELVVIDRAEKAAYIKRTEEMDHKMNPNDSVGLICGDVCNSATADYVRISIIVSSRLSFAVNGFKS
jgi:hypothetical protein